MFTVKETFIAETEEKDSRFIAHLVPIENFTETLEALRKSHRKASHHVTAFRQINAQNQISEIGKDDGEPSGTSGMPVLKTLIGADLINVAMIVTRYFGGTKLGTGGLARAYSAASNAAIENANLVLWERTDSYEVKVSFERSSEAERQISMFGLRVIDRQFTEAGVSIFLDGPKKQIDKLVGSLLR